MVAGTVAFAAIALSIPSAFAIWRALERLADQAATYLVLGDRAPRLWVQGAAKDALRDAVMILAIFALGLWVIPFVAQLLSLGPLSVPLPFMVVASLVYFAFRFLRRVHRHLVEIFSRTFLGGHHVGGPGQQVGGEEESAAGGRHRPAVTVRSEFAPPVPPEVRPGPDGATAPAPGRAVSAADAEISAIRVAEHDPSPYASRMGSAPIIWEFKEAAEVDGHFVVTLRFRDASAPAWDHGEEDFYVDGWGHVTVRQIRSWPKSAGSGFSPHIVYAGALAAMAVALAAGVVYLLR